MCVPETIESELQPSLPNFFEYDEHDPLDRRQASDLEGQLTVHNILKSYRSNYDLFAEAVQNAMDAVHTRWRLEHGTGFTPRVKVIVDLSGNSFTVIDNGTGIPPADCLSVFAPNFSLKSRIRAQPGQRLRGHKGVGATFLAYGFDRTDIASKASRDVVFTGRLNGGRRWAEGLDDTAPRPMLKPYEEESRDFASIDRGTLLRVVCGTGTSPAALGFYGVDLATWEGILRIETAIGMFSEVVDDGFVPEITLRLIQQGGSELEGQIPCNYLFPHELLDDRRFLNMEAYAADNPGPAIDKKHTNKDGLYRRFTDGQIRSEFSDLRQPGGTEPLPLPDERLWLYVFRSYSASFFREQSRTPEGRRMAAGIRIAADSMPIGSIQRISGLNRFTYSQNTVHMVLHIDGAEPDIGRKGFSDQVTQLGQAFAKELIERKLQSWNPFLRSEVGPRQGRARLEEWKFSSRDHEQKHPLPSWPGTDLCITSIPDREQDVIALFHELLGAKALLGYRVLSTSQHEQYDSLMRIELSADDVARVIYDRQQCPWGVEDYRAQELTRDAIIEAVEYKLLLDGLIVDLRAERKKFQDVELAIAWDASEDFDEKFEDYELTELQIPSQLSLRQYPAQTHELRSGGESGVVPVILLKRLFDSVGG